MRIPTISAYAALKVARGVLWISTGKGPLKSSVAFYLGTIPHLIEALQSAVQLTNAGQDESTTHAPVQIAPEHETTIIEIPVSSRAIMYQVFSPVMCQPFSPVMRQQR